MPLPRCTLGGCLEAAFCNFAVALHAWMLRCACAVPCRRRAARLEVVLKKDKRACGPQRRRPTARLGFVSHVHAATTDCAFVPRRHR
eukprot:187990-Chlamydomonas_euryale.AAC.1